MPSAAVRDAFALSWLGCMSAHLLLHTLESMSKDNGVYDDWPLAVAMRADENAYVAHLASHLGRTNLVLSSDLVGAYSVRRWYYAFYALRETLQEVAWTPSAGDYFRALVLRYAMLLLKTNEPAVMYDHPKLCGGGGGGGDHSGLQLQLPGRLNLHMIFALERPVFYAMRHHMAASALVRAAPHPWTPTPLDWRRRALLACKEFAANMASHESLKFGAIDRVREGLFATEVLPGECEEVAFGQQLPPGRVADPDATLYETRRDRYMEMQPLQTEAVASLVARWVDAVLALPSSSDPQTWDMAAAQRVKGERVAVMAITRCLDLWLEFIKDGSGFSWVGHAFPDDNARAPPKDAPPLSPAAALAAVGGAGPVYVAVHQVYAVVWSENTFTTPHFVEALARWLQVAVAQGRLRAESLRGTPLKMLLKALPS